MSLRERKATEKKTEIIRSAVSIMAEKGYHATTMEDIASKLLMTKGSIYYYFRDKQDLVYQSQIMLLEQSIKNIQDIKQKDLPVTEKLREVMVNHIEYLISEKSGFSIKVNPDQIFEGHQLQAILQLGDDYEKCMDQLLTEGIESGVFSSVDIKIVRNIFLGAMNWIIRWYSPEGKQSKADFAELISNYLLRILNIDSIKNGLEEENENGK